MKKKSVNTCVQMPLSHPFGPRFWEHHYITVVLTKLHQSRYRSGLIACIDSKLNRGYFHNSSEPINVQRITTAWWFMKLSAQVILWCKLAYWWRTSEVEPPNHISNTSGQNQTRLQARDFQTGVKGHPGPSQGTPIYYYCCCCCCSWWIGLGIENWFQLDT